MIIGLRISNQSQESGIKFKSFNEEVTFNSSTLIAKLLSKKPVTFQSQFVCRELLVLEYGDILKQLIKVYSKEKCAQLSKGEKFFTQVYSVIPDNLDFSKVLLTTRKLFESSFHSINTSNFERIENILRVYGKEETRELCFEFIVPIFPYILSSLLYLPKYFPTTLETFSDSTKTGESLLLEILTKTWKDYKTSFLLDFFTYLNIYQIVTGEELQVIKPIGQFSINQLEHYGPCSYIQKELFRNLSAIRRFSNLMPPSIKKSCKSEALKDSKKYREVDSTTLVMTMISSFIN